MGQDIRFCKTSDGVRIAYAVSGTGPPLVISSGWVTNIEEVFKESQAYFWAPLQEHFTLINYDKRGCGLSDRDVPDLSLDAREPDLLAVLEAAKVEKFYLYGVSEGGPLSIKFAALNPGRVEKLVLYGTFARGTSLPQSEAAGKALAELVRAQWGLGSRVITDMWMPGAGREQHDEFTRFERVAASGEVAAAILEADYATDVTGYLGAVKVPTLVGHARGDRAVRFTLGREIAAGIPAARLVAFETNQHVLTPELFNIWHEQVIDFLLDRPEGTARRTMPVLKSTAQSEPTAGTVTILFLDIVDSTTLTLQIGDAAFRARSRDLDAALRDVIRVAGGTPVEGKLLGDGIMATFASASRAIEAALACNVAASSTELRLHLGLHAGDVISEGDNVYGGTVNLAARVCGISEPGEVLVSETVRALARTSSAVRFEDRGLHELKGIEEPQRLFAARPAG